MTVEYDEYSDDVRKSANFKRGLPSKMSSQAVFKHQLRERITKNARETDWWKRRIGVWTWIKDICRSARIFSRVHASIAQRIAHTTASQCDFELLDKRFLRLSTLIRQNCRVWACSSFKKWKNSHGGRAGSMLLLRDVFYMRVYCRENQEHCAAFDMTVFNNRTEQSEQNHRQNLHWVSVVGVVWPTAAQRCQLAWRWTTTNVQHDSRWRCVQVSIHAGFVQQDELRHSAQTSLCILHKTRCANASRNWETHGSKDKWDSSAGILSQVQASPNVLHAWLHRGAILSCLTKAFKERKGKVQWRARQERRFNRLARQNENKTVRRCKHPNKEVIASRLSFKKVFVVFDAYFIQRPPHWATKTVRNESLGSWRQTPELCHLV